MSSIAMNHLIADVDFASTPKCVDESDRFLVSVVMPCLNEARTVEACIRQAKAGCKELKLLRTIGERTSASRSSVPAASDQEIAYEVVIADNGSTDGSQEIAVQAGAKVVSISERGYGAALIGGIAAARGKYVVMGDADCSYDFGEIPKFVEKLDEGFDLVMGNRFAGEIKPGAMPWHHRYVGNPLLSGLGRILYGRKCRDFHCGLRAFSREKMVALKLKCSGMEFASEMIIRASQVKFRIAEIPITLHPDGRGRRPHLRSIRDGLRHLSLLFRLKLTRLSRTTVSENRVRVVDCFVSLGEEK